MKTYRLILAGLGNVNRSLLSILLSQEALLAERYGLAFSVVGAADTGGAAIDPAGLDLAALLAAKRAGASAASLPHVGRPGVSALDLARSLDADALLEATPVNLRDGQPGLDVVRAALGRGIACVLANKGPLALAYAELAGMSDLASQGMEQSLPHPPLRFSACVGGSMPSINVGWRDLAGCRVERVEAVLNGTTQGILRAMEQGVSYADALAEMQRRGLAETDPTLDVEGWDAANKIVILANAVLRRPSRLADVAVEGITRLTADNLRAATARGERIVLLCLAEPAGDTYRLSVRPTALPADHPLARMDADEMGIVYYTDISGRLSMTTRETDPVPTAAAMLRDTIEVFT
ncbi:MAG TPA: homoserine dehydrogenase [Roseiflexaceae bacterium]|nr:homoserine dehydrogenase [Roseiflexaceae bacterium]